MGLHKDLSAPCLIDVYGLIVLLNDGLNVIGNGVGCVWISSICNYLYSGLSIFYEFFTKVLFKINYGFNFPLLEDTLYLGFRI